MNAPLQFAIFAILASSGSVLSCRTSASRLADLDSTRLVWRNQGWATGELSADGRVYSIEAPAHPGNAIRGRELVVTNKASWSATAIVVPLLQARRGGSCGLYVTDGSRLLTLSVVAGSDYPSLNLMRWNSNTTFNSVVQEPFGGRPGELLLPGSPIIRVERDSKRKKLDWSYSIGPDADVAKYTEIAREDESTWLSGGVQAVGVYADSPDSEEGAICRFVYWKLN